jgi:integrase
MKVRRRRYKSGNVGWQLDCGMVNGKRLQLAFETKDQADGEKTRRLAELKRGGELAFAITDEERLRYIAVRDKLAVAGATIEQACEYYIRHAKPLRGPVTFDVLRKLCEEAKEEEGLRDRSVKALKSVGLIFSRAGHGGKLCDSITTDDVKRWLRSNEWSDRTWNGYRSTLSSIFNWGIEQKYCVHNPCLDVVIKSLEDEDIRFLNADQVEALFRRAEKVGLHTKGLGRDEKGRLIANSPEQEDFRDFIPFLVLGHFCGLRPERELGEMDDMRDIHLEEKIVIVKGQRAKTRGRRIVELSDNAVAWLKAFPKDGKVLPVNFARRWRRLREQAGVLEGWPQDAMRHTFATYHFAHHQNEDKLKAQMGHTKESNELHTAYRGLGRPADAKKFWELRPQGKGLTK